MGIQEEEFCVCKDAAPLPIRQFFFAEIIGQSDRDRATIYQNLLFNPADFVTRFGRNTFDQRPIWPGIPVLRYPFRG
jgi:hypothetical protein